MFRDDTGPRDQSEVIKIKPSLRVTVVVVGSSTLENVCGNCTNVICWSVSCDMQGRGSYCHQWKSRASELKWHLLQEEVCLGTCHACCACGNPHADAEWPVCIWSVVAGNSEAGGCDH